MVVLLLLILLGFLLLLVGTTGRRRAGLGPGRTISHDHLTLFSHRWHLVGVPDRIVRRGGLYFPEDKKPGRNIQDSHRAQMGVYFLLVEEHFGKRPPYGVIVLGDGRRASIANTPQLRAQVLYTADQIRQARQRLRRPVEATPFPAKCRTCSQRENCPQKAG